MYRIPELVLGGILERARSDRFRSSRAVDIRLGHRVLRLADRVLRLAYRVLVLAHRVLRLAHRVLRLHRRVLRLVRIPAQKIPMWSNVTLELQLLTVQGFPQLSGPPKSHNRQLRVCEIEIVTHRLRLLAQSVQRQRETGVHHPEDEALACYDQNWKNGVGAWGLNLNISTCIF